jgi:serine-type D-Ala-D-Ala carboxypeptidase/endopeptidase
MPKSLLFLILLGLTGIIIGVMQARSLAQTPTSSEIEAILKQRIENKQGVGIVVGLITPKGRRIISYGRLSKTDARKPDGNTVFEIGSVSKVFTAILLADSVQRKELKLTDAIAPSLPSLVKLSKTITFLDLATHTSGLPRLPENLDSKDPENPYADYTISRLYEFLSSYQLPREVGAQYEYSNLGFGLLGHILSLKTNTDYETLVVNRIAKPLRMQSTSIELTQDMKSRFATGHNGISEPVKNWDFPTLAGAGALRSTTNDLLTFLSANLGLTSSKLYPTLQSAQILQRPANSPDVSMGLGWHIITRKDGTQLISHTGGTGGYRSFVGFDPKKRLGVVVLANSAHDHDDIGMHLLDPQSPLKKQRTAIAIDPKLYDAYVGRYELMPNFILTIAKEENRLFLQATNQPKVELFPETTLDFFIKEVEAQVTFVKDAQGKVNQLILHQAGQHLPAKRIP